MMDYSIAAVVVTYNRKESLLTCLDSILKQSFLPKSIFVVDNASTDGSMDYVKESGFFDKEVPINYIYLDKNGGGALGFYTGMKAAYENGKCDGVWMMDDDGIPDTDELKCLLQQFSKYDCVASLVVSDKDASLLSFPFFKYTNTVDLLNVFGEKGVIENEVRPFNGILYSKKLIATVGFPKPDMFIYGDEYNYHVRIDKAGFKVATILNAIHRHPMMKGDFKVYTVLGKEIRIRELEGIRFFCFHRNYLYNYVVERNFKKFLYHILIYTIYYLNNYIKLRLFYEALFESRKRVFSKHLRYLKK